VSDRVPHPDCATCLHPAWDRPCAVLVTSAWRPGAPEHRPGRALCGCTHPGQLTQQEQAERWALDQCGCLTAIGRTWSGACFGFGEPGAARTHRYTLWRRWDERPPLVAVMLNPSTADESVLDPTLRRVRGYAQAWGYGGFVIGNAFALRSTDPKGLLADPYGAVGGWNDAHLRALRALAAQSRLMVGWGSNLTKRAMAIPYPWPSGVA
jgi:hypothetical protein